MKYIIATLLLLAGYSGYTQPYLLGEGGKKVYVSSPLVISNGLLTFNGSGGGSASGDSLVRTLSTSRQYDYYHMERVGNIKDSQYVWNFPSGPNEFDFVVISPTRALLLYDDGNDTRGVWASRNPTTNQITIPRRSAAQMIAGIYNTPEGDSSLSDGGVPPNNDALLQMHYPTGIFDPRDSMIYVYYYKFSQNTYMKKGRTLKEIRDCPEVNIGIFGGIVFNDAHVRRDPAGGIVMVAHLIDQPGIAFARSRYPEGPFVIQDVVNRAADVGAEYTPAMEFLPDPEWHFDGARRYTMGVSHVGFREQPDLSRPFTYPSVRSVGWIQEISANTTGKIKQISKPIAIALYDYSNPVFVNWGGRQYIAMSRAASSYPNPESMSVDPDRANQNLGRFILAELSDKTQFESGREDRYALQIKAGSSREVATNRTIIKSGNGVATNTPSGLTVSSGTAGYWGLLNHGYLSDFVATVTFTVAQVPAPGQYGLIFAMTTDTPNVNKAAIAFVVNSAGNIGARFTESDGTVTFSPFVGATVGVRTTLKLQNSQGQFILSTGGATQFGIANPFRNNRARFYNLFNKQTDSVGAGDQFYGTIHGIDIMRPDDGAVQTLRVDNATISTKYRKVIADAGNIGAMTVNLPVTDAYGSGYTGVTFDDEYTVTKQGGNSVTIKVPNQSDVVLNVDGETATFRYTEGLGYRLLAKAGGVSAVIPGNNFEVLTSNGVGGANANSSLQYSPSLLGIYSNAISRLRLMGMNNAITTDIAGYNNGFFMLVNDVPTIHFDLGNGGIIKTPFQVVGGSSLPTSTVFNVLSTTRGSLPVPRMTCAQARAITSPEPLLQVGIIDDDPGGAVPNAHGYWHWDHIANTWVPN